LFILNFKFRNIWRKYSPIFKWQITGNSPNSPLVRPVDPWRGSLSQGEKSFLSHPKIISEDYWNSFEWLRDLREIGSEKARVRSRNLVDEWHNLNPFWDEGKWSPRLISKRLSNILFCYGTFADTADSDFQERLMKQFTSQARCLELDWRIIKNNSEKLYVLLGMMAGRTCLTKETGEINYIIETVIDEIHKIINDDGMHISRKPQLQLETLKIIIEIQYLGKSSKKYIREKYNNIVNKLTSSSKMLQHVDGTIINFNGGSKFEKETVSQLISKSDTSVKTLVGISQDGYSKFNSKSTSIIFDIGSPYRASHNWHAGTLSFELSSGKNLILVNSGFLEMDTGWTNALRGTSAHSTVSIDGKNSSNIEKNAQKERVARVFNKKLEKTSYGFNVSAKHDGYFSSYGIYHKRELFLNKEGDKVQGVDELINTGAPGSIPIEAEVRFHLHPDIKVAKTLSGDIMLRLKNGSGWIFKTNESRTKLEDSIFIKSNNVFKSQQILINVPLSNLRSSKSKVINWEFFKKL